MKIFLIQPKAKAAFKNPPLGLQLIATVLKEHRYENIYDIDRDKGDDPYALDYSGEDVIAGLSVTFMTISEAFNLAKFIKSKNPRTTVVFGGPQPTLMPEESIGNENVDVVVIGEGQHTMLELADRVREKGPLNGIKGIWYKNGGGEVVKNEPREFIKDLDALPYLDKTFFNDRHYQKYQQTVMERLFLPPTWAIMSAYSCPYSCKMCQPALRKIAGPWRQRSVGNVVTEIKSLKHKYNARRFLFYDNDMGINRNWMYEFCHQVREVGNISMACCGRANLLDYDILKCMREAGFDSISFGAESGSNRVLKEIMNKKTTVQNIIDLANNCYKLKIKPYAFWMLASPGETVAEMKQTVDLASELPVFYCHFHIATPNPGTQYHIDALLGGYLNLRSWDDVNDRRHPTIIKDNVSADDIVQIDEYLIKAMLKKGWNYRYNGHTLSFINTRLFAKWYPLKVLGNEINMFLHDFKPYHMRNIFLGAKSLVGVQ